MAFSFANAGTGPGPAVTMGQPAGGVQAQMGPELEEIQTDSLGFLALAGERKIQLLPSPWPANALPSPTSSLLSVASNKGLVAAAGVDALVVASTDSIRAAFNGEPGDSNILPFQPQLKMPMPSRISQVAFTADESYLIISAEQGGGLAVYSVDALMQGITNTAFELGTDGVALRALCPNPASDRADQVALITSNGSLLVANLNQRQYVAGPNGQVLRQNVSCLSWSTKGKQLVAGMADGTSYQMTPEGQGKAEIPRPPSLTGGEAVTAISWLENNVFLTVHTPISSAPDVVPESTFHIITRKPPSAFTIQKMPDPCFPSGLNRSPPHHFFLRLKDFPPDLQDALVVSSTCSTDVGLLTKAKAPLTDDMVADKVVGQFTATAIGNDSRRAQLPMTEDMSDTSTIGMAMDLSSKVNVPRPLMGEDLDQSRTPLPELLVLNNEGVLAAWWFVYAASIEQGTAYPGLIAAGGTKSPPPVMSSAPSASSQPLGGFSAPAFGAPAAPAFGAPAAPGGAFGPAPALQNPATTNLMGTSTGMANFGSATSLGVKASPWSTPTSVATSQGIGTTVGQPVFGSSTPLGASTQGSAFGRSNLLGAQQSPWATAGFANSSPGTSLNKPADTNPTSGASGAGFTTTSPASGGFGSYANQGGFGAVAASADNGASIFGAPSAGPFSLNGGAGMDTDSSFGRPQNANNKQLQSPFGAAAGGFSLGSIFKGDGTAKDDAPRPAPDSGNSFFGSAFGSSLQAPPETAKAPASQEADMDAEVEESAPEKPEQPSETARESTTPTSSPDRTPSVASKPGVGGTFGTLAQSDVTPASVETSAPATLPFEGPPAPSRITPEPEPSSSPTTSEPESSSSPTTPQPKARGETEDSQETPSPVKEESSPTTPLPPIPTSKTPYAIGDSSASSEKTAPEDAPLPPDFLPKREGRGSTDEDEPALPPEDSDDQDDWEGSGEDVAQDLSQSNDFGRTPRITPQSSFGDPHDPNRSPVGGPFTKISHPAKPPSSKPLFGEVGSMFNSNISFPPPAAQQDFNSPSPVRSVFPKIEVAPKSSSSNMFPALEVSHNTAGDLQADNTRGQDAGHKEPAADEEAAQSVPADDKEWTDKKEEEAEEEGPSVRAQLEADIAPTRSLPPFVAHQDYIGRIKHTGIGGEIERLYHDINSMIDTLGLNAKALKAFVMGHSEQAKDAGRSREDLEAEDDWCLVEVPELGRVEDDISEQLEQGQIQNPPEKLRACHDLRDDVAKVRYKYGLLRQAINARTDPVKLAAVRAAPLSGEQTVQQQEIRAELLRVQQLLSQAEEEVTMLRAKLASTRDARGRPPPRMEAVIRTIMRLTSMVEKKSGDVDMLESQIRKLKVEDGKENEDGPDDLSIYATPQGRTSSNGFRTPRTSASTGTYGLFYTPDSSPSSSRRPNSSHWSPATLVGGAGAGPSPLASSLVGTPSGRAVNDISAEQLNRKREREARNREVAEKLSNILSKTGPRVHSV